MKTAFIVNACIGLVLWSSFIYLMPRTFKQSTLLNKVKSFFAVVFFWAIILAPSFYKGFKEGVAKVKESEE